MSIRLQLREVGLLIYRGFDLRGRNNRMQNMLNRGEAWEHVIRMLHLCMLLLRFYIWIYLIQMYGNMQEQ